MIMQYKIDSIQYIYALALLRKVYRLDLLNGVCKGGLDGGLDF